jgi:DNA polymerase III delta subunit
MNNLRKIWSKTEKIILYTGNCGKLREKAVQSYLESYPQNVDNVDKKVGNMCLYKKYC